MKPFDLNGFIKWREKIKAQRLSDEQFDLILNYFEDEKQKYKELHNRKRGDQSQNAFTNYYARFIKADA